MTAADPMSKSAVMGEYIKAYSCILSALRRVEVIEANAMAHCPPCDGALLSALAQADAARKLLDACKTGLGAIICQVADQP